MIETGTVLQQRYRIDEQIGQGGMGAVYVATDERFGSTVAIKETLCMDDNYRKALEREARLLNSLKHAALPRVSDHFIEDNGQFLVMEYIPGDDLSVILEKTGEPFEFERVEKWAEQLLDALDFLHNQSMPVIHRDIKPQNLKLTDKDEIVLLDFGLAKGNPTDASFQTAAKSIFGYSRNYASLEQIQGTGTDPRSDLYSLAATLYHLATGQPPEDALTRAMAVLSHQPDPLVPASAVCKDIPAGFAGVLQKAMDLNANNRPASAREMREMLQDPDRFAHLAEISTAPKPIAETGLGAQKTKLMPGVTNHRADGQTGVKTEVLPVYNSEETSVRVPLAQSAGAAGSGRSGGKRHLAMAAAAALLLICGIAAGAYVYDPTMFSGRHDPAPDPQPAPVQPQAEPSTAPDIVGAGEAPAEKPADPQKDQQASVESDKAPAKTTPKTVKTGRSERAEANINVVDLDDLDDLDDVDLKGKTIYVGNIMIKDGKIETPKVFVNENGIIPKVPLAPMPDLKNLTPEQRRKMMELRRRGFLGPPASPVPPRTRN